MYRILYSRWWFWAGSERPFAVGVVSLNSDICPISLKPAPKDAGAAPASFGTGLSEIGQIAELRDANRTANGLSDPAQNRNREYSIRYSLTPRVLNIVHCHQVIMKAGALKFFVRFFDILKIEFHMCILGPKIRRTQTILGICWILDTQDTIYF